MTSKKIIFVIVVFGVMVSCSNAKQEENGCVMPANFKESDLIGTWKATDLEEDYDILIIEESGYYKQILHKENPSINYESDWENWHVEYSDEGIPYVYFENLMLCVYHNSMKCNEKKGGSWWDYCANGFVDTISEGILIVQDYSEKINQPPSDIQLLSLAVGTEGSLTAYRRQAP